ncbi:DNA cytosine methyltransferase [bacterium]|nr:DNA cytosine methyltransferase [Chloroflexi bacterium CFX6]RIL10849.1 MAG: DNA cytosine methyltransferase [bacterium]
MRISWRVIVIGLLAVLLAVFVAQNWAAFTAPADLVVFFSVVPAPLGLVMLGILGGVALVLLLLMATQRTSALMEFRRYAREADAAHKLADAAELSRITELQATLTAEMASLRQSLADTADRLRAEGDARGNVLTAHLGQIEDRLERAGIGGGEGPAVDRPGA